ncbi:hypothetical protein [Streptomyces sp. NPDC058045]|uniref:hypothetical protein n=1 Tax=Streptomyces sp. NPDC058045 TaxID=3346311 RepID=UPI0036F143BA
MTTAVAPADHRPVTPDLQSLRLRVAVPDPASHDGEVEVRPHIDGLDVVAEVFDPEPGLDPRHLLLPGGPLEAGPVPREVCLAEARCTEGCCGALYVTIRLDGDQVIWGGWRNPDEETVDLPEFRFDARQYRTEVERATSDHSWEWPARTIARLLEEELRQRTDWLERWECELSRVAATFRVPDRIELVLFHPGRSAITAGRPWLQFRLTLAIAGEDPAAEAHRLAEELTAGDPRSAAEVCGGSAEFARALGYPWPYRPRR